MNSMPLVTADRVYRASDLNRRGREVLDAARRSGARIVDTDGTALVMVTEGALDAALRGLGVVGLQLAAMRAWRELSSGGDVTADSLRWANLLDDEDRVTFARELAAAFDETTRTADVTALQRLLHEWETTARLPQDDGLGARIAAGFAPGDYVEVERPVDSTA